MKNFISIPKPCHESWEAMTPQEQGRHCAKCNVVVKDFSEMSNEEILSYLEERTTKTCGRFSETQLVSQPTFSQKLKKFIYAFALVFLPFVPVDSFGQNLNTEITTTKANFSSIQGIVIDSAQNPIANAIVTIYKGRRLVVTGKTNLEGKFSFQNLSKGRYKIDIKAKNFFGLYGRKIKLSKGFQVKIDVKLEPGKEIVIGMCHRTELIEEPVG